MLKVLLQHAETRKYVGKNRKWTERTEEALAFPGVVEALDYALSRGIGEVQTVIKCRDSRWDVSLPPVSKGK
ncbi:MAG TPA: hypothetical protein VNT26_09050 [Candidatus Sulfotelmatobacter sp.]|nr:hypothetical protein [Candidatus Sulfotelmatobacter sp.]